MYPWRPQLRRRHGTVYPRRPPRREAQQTTRLRRRLRPRRRRLQLQRKAVVKLAAVEELTAVVELGDVKVLVESQSAIL